MKLAQVPPASFYSRTGSRTAPPFLHPPNTPYYSFGKLLYTDFRSTCLAPSRSSSPCDLFTHPVVLWRRKKLKGTLEHFSWGAVPQESRRLFVATISRQFLEKKHHMMKMHEDSNTQPTPHFKDSADCHDWALWDEKNTADSMVQCPSAASSSLINLLWWNNLFWSIRRHTYLTPPQEKRLHPILKHLPGRFFSTEGHHVVITEHERLLKLLSCFCLECQVCHPSHTGAMPTTIFQHGSVSRIIWRSEHSKNSWAFQPSQYLPVDLAGRASGRITEVCAVHRTSLSVSASMSLAFPISHLQTSIWEQRLQAYPRIHNHFMGGPLWGSNSWCLAKIEWNWGLEEAMDSQQILLLF